MTASAFSASYSEWRLVKTRGVVQLIFEVPLHQSDAAYHALGGMPDAAQERWFAIARLNEDRKEAMSDTHKKQTTDTPPRSDDLPVPDGASIPDKPVRRRTPVAPEKRLAQRAALMCIDPVFQKYLCDNFDLVNCNEEGAANMIRQICDVESRSQILPGSPAANKFDRLYGQFIAWRNAPEMADT